VLETFVAMRVPVAPVNDLEALVHDPQVLARGSLLRRAHPVHGEIVVTAPSPRLSATPGELRSIGPALGEHNDEIYRGLLGMDANRVASLRAARVI
jgi:formyl-CoA transferase